MTSIAWDTCLSVPGHIRAQTGALNLTAELRMWTKQRTKTEESRSAKMTDQIAGLENAGPNNSTSC